MRNSYLEVDLSAISHNIKVVKEKLGNTIEIMPVIKANAYGIGSRELKEVLDKNNIKMVAVAIPMEGIELINRNINADILVLNQLLDEEEIQNVVDNNMIAGVSRYEIAEQIDEYSKNNNKISIIHIEIDTGMGRVGIQVDEALEFVQKVSKLRNVKVEGIYTHFSSADSSREYTLSQIEKFDKVIQILNQNGYEFKYIHASASSGIINFEEAKYNLVREGIMLYGYYPDKSMKEKIELMPSTKLKSKIVFLKTVEENVPISYSRTYITNKKTKVATIPIGYADGIRRDLSNKGRVYINGKYAPIIGNVCMDNFMIDVTSIDNVKVGDEVIIWDNENIELEEVARICDTINYEILCGISNRIPRKYINKDKI